MKFAWESSVVRKKNVPGERRNSNSRKTLGESKFKLPIIFHRKMAFSRSSSKKRLIKSFGLRCCFHYFRGRRISGNFLQDSWFCLLCNITLLIGDDVDEGLFRYQFIRRSVAQFSPRIFPFCVTSMERLSIEVFISLSQCYHESVASEKKFYCL